MTAGFFLLQEYAATPGVSLPPGREAAALVAKFKQPARGLVIMAVHPSCPCTDASFAELGDLLARSEGRCDAVILEYRPLTPPTDWPASVAVRELGGVKVPTVIDAGGKAAAALGAHTSGHALFIDAHGTVRFHGGITIARGHRGRAPAQDAILAALRGADTPISAAPVYGCALEPECKAESTQ